MPMHTESPTRMVDFPKGFPQGARGQPPHTFLNLPHIPHHSKQTAVLHLWLLYLETRTLSFDDREKPVVEEIEWQQSSQASGTSGDESERSSGSGLSRSSTGTTGSTTRRQEWDRHPAGRSHTLVFCYLGCIMLRLPVLLTDFHRYCGLASPQH